MYKYKVNVQIYGETYALKSDTDEQRVLKVAQVLNEQMKMIARANPSLSPTKVAVLAALNITEELLKLEEDYKQLLAMVEDEKKA